MNSQNTNQTNQSSKTLIIVLIAVVLVIGVGGVVIASQQRDNTTSNDNQSTTTTVNSDTIGAEVQDNDNSSTNQSSQSTPIVDNVKNESNAKGSYLDYKPELVSSASTEKVVLFFHATWCPSCRSTDSDIKKNLDSIPSDITILKVDYDSNQDLRRKYGVTSQHTFVEVSKNGDQVNKKLGLATLQDIISFVN